MPPAAPGRGSSIIFIGSSAAVDLALAAAVAGLLCAAGALIALDVIILPKLGGAASTVVGLTPGLAPLNSGEPSGSPYASRGVIICARTSFSSRRCVCCCSSKSSATTGRAVVGVRATEKRPVLALLMNEPKFAPHALSGLMFSALGTLPGAAVGPSGDVMGESVGSEFVLVSENGRSFDAGLV